MEEVLDALLEWVELHPVWAGWVVFAVSLAESLAIVGMVVPGVVILFGVGALIATGAVGFWAMAAWAIAGAIIGDGLSYWLGRRYKDSLPELWPFNRFPEALAQGEQFFRRYGALSVAFARFFGPGRATVPLVAGMLAMSRGPFLIANVGSALLWGPAFLLPGVLFGASLEIASEVALGLVALLAILVVVIWFSGWFAHRVFRWYQPHAGAVLQRLLALGEHRPWLRQIAETMGNPEHPEARGLATYAGLLMLSAGVLIIASPLLSIIQPWSAGDVLLARTLASLRNDFADRFLLPLAHWDDLAVILFTCAFVGAALAIGRRWQALTHWAVSTAFALALSISLNTLHAGPQPGGLVPDPSVLASGILFGQAVIFVVRPAPTRLRWAVYSTGVILAALGGFARFYFALTNLGGILTASLLAIAWVGGIGMAYRTHAHSETISGGIAALSIAGLLAGFALAIQVAPLKLPSAERPEPIQLSQSSWRDQGQRKLPELRIDLRRESEHPLNLQYAGDLATIDQDLRSVGWEPVKSQRAADLMRMLSPSTPLAQLPVLPHVHESAHESAAWVKNLEDTRFVVRLWPSDHEIVDTGPLWLGSVSMQHKRTRFRLLTFAVTSKEFERPLKTMRSALAGRVTEVAAPTELSPWMFKSSTPPSTNNG